MKNLLLRIYDFLQAHRRWQWIGWLCISIPLIILAATLRYNEDIMDFLPVTEEERQQLKEYNSQASASRIFLIVEGADEDRRYDAIDACAERIPELETDFDIGEQLKAVYAQLPSLIADSTYDRFDSLFTPEAIRAALQRDRLTLSTPGTGVLATAIQHDPLGLVQLSNHQSQITNNHRSYAFVTTPYGSTESRHNAALVDSLNAVTKALSADFPDLNIRWIGAPVIAIGNARRIKLDTMLCIALSLVLIIALLAYAFPRRRDIWLILWAISFGWLVGMAVLRIFTPAVSAVVLGIGSVLIGIAVNYPLHLLVHQRYTSSVRQTLDEVLSPLVVGNITTVGAFLALVPLQATALRHLGIFAAAMLVGTILFCIFVMPHLMSAEPTPVRDIKFLNRQTTSNNLKQRQTISNYLILALTLVFGAYLTINYQLSTVNFFDSNLTHINYMTAQQRADMAAFDLSPKDATRWTDYWRTHNADSVIAIIQSEATAAGFKPEAFAPFYETLSEAQSPIGNRPVINFNIVASRLSADFDYIGLVCSIIVFAFLWLSFRNFWLALIAFVPMALSWVWILAIMQLFGLQFNIVNIILATFIFGQGDDYTIFIVEGLLYEHRTGKPMLPQYRQSIILSAAIMLIGIGILVLAVHPAMHSLGAVTLIGMTIVLLMANTVPPMLFRLYTRLSKHPL